MLQDINMKTHLPLPVLICSQLVAATAVAAGGGPEAASISDAVLLEGGVRYLLTTCTLPRSQRTEAMDMSRRYEATLATKPGMTRESVAQGIEDSMNALKARENADPAQRENACIELATRCLLAALASRDAGVTELTGVAGPTLTDWPVVSNNECDPSVQPGHPHSATPAVVPRDSQR